MGGVGEAAASVGDDVGLRGEEQRAGEAVKPRATMTAHIAHPRNRRESPTALAGCG